MSFYIAFEDSFTSYFQCNYILLSDNIMFQNKYTHMFSNENLL